MASIDSMGRRVQNRLNDPPDPRPSRRMGELLAHRRRQGLPWPDAAEFNRLAELAVMFVPDQYERLDWKAVLADQRSVWQLAYRRELVVRRGLEEAG